MVTRPGYASNIRHVSSSSLLVNLFKNSFPFSFFDTWKVHGFGE